jgi:hypothetical protein
MKKSKIMDLRTLWQKAPKPNSTSTPCSQTIGMQQQQIDAIPITKDDAIPTTENDGQPSTEAASTDHEICSPFTLPQIIEDHESSDNSDNESDDGTIYDIDLGCGLFSMLMLSMNEMQSGGVILQ